MNVLGWDIGHDRNLAVTVERPDGPMIFRLLSCLLLCLLLPAAALAKPYTTPYAGAEVFRDRNGNGLRDAKEPAVITGEDGRFEPPKAPGRLFLQGGRHRITGEVNALRLTTPNQVRSIDVLTSLWQELLKRKLSEGKIRKLLSLEPKTQLIEFSPIPSDQASVRQKRLQARNNQAKTLTSFVNALSSGSIRPRLSLRAQHGLTPLTAAGIPGGDPLIGALAENLLNLRQTAVNLSDESILLTLLDGTLQRLETPAPADTLQVAAAAGVAINREFEVRETAAEILKVDQIRANGALHLQAGNLDILTERYVGDGVINQLQTEPFPPPPEMVRLPAGEFLMGSDASDPEADPDEFPLHRVQVATFAIGRYEVTQAEWRRVMGNNPSDFSFCGDACPVESVSFEDIQVYIARLNQLTGGRYRLPTEAEWEYACRAGGRQRYCGSDDVNAVAWYIDNADDQPHPVGKKRPNAWGLYDMSGNVFEWTCSAYTEGYQGSETTCANQAGDLRVYRGGSWFNEASVVRAALRVGEDRTERDYSLGFRLAQD